MTLDWYKVGEINFTWLEYLQIAAAFVVAAFLAAVTHFSKAGDWKWVEKGWFKKGKKLDTKDKHTVSQDNGTKGRNP